ncbi:hypothetical protein BGZ47_006319 [Haplosporangium gracile]|nr:hypothetical protein BGZ47_006319 [Haplosporangium gracile]
MKLADCLGQGGRAFKTPSKQVAGIERRTYRTGPTNSKLDVVSLIGIHRFHSTTVQFLNIRTNAGYTHNHVGELVKLAAQDLKADRCKFLFIIGDCWGVHLAIRAFLEPDQVFLGAAGPHTTTVTLPLVANLKCPLALFPAMDDPDMVPIIQAVQDQGLSSPSVHDRFDKAPHGSWGGRGDWTIPEHNEAAAQQGSSEDLRSSMISNSTASSNAALASGTAAEGATTTTAQSNDDLTLKALKDAATVMTAECSEDQNMDLKQADSLDLPTASSPSSSDISKASDNTTAPALSLSSSSGSVTLTGMVTSATITTQDHLNENNKRLISLTAQWNGKKLPFEVDLDYTIGELKNKLMELTNVEPKRQKLMLVRGKLPDDSVVLSSLSLKNNQTFLMMGTPEAKVIKAPEVMPEVLNDLEEDYTPDDEAFASMAQNQKSLRSTVAKCDINIMHPMRPGKKLLVLDLDYTLIDCKALNNPLVEVIRPGLHEFLSVCYEEYDIVIWSQTSWRALEAKVTTIGLLTHADYKISFVMDISTMFSVLSQRDGKPFKHQVKALDIIYSKFPQYSAKNTVHVDDLSRNFAMNPKSGVKIGAYKNGALSRHTDRELYHLAKYLLFISKSHDLKEHDHKNWKGHRKSHR